MFITEILFKIINKCRLWYWQIAGTISLKVRGINLGKQCVFYGLPIISRFPGSTISIGDRVVLCSDSRFTALGVNHPVILRTLRKETKIFIDSDCGLSGTTICAAKSIYIGKQTLIGANVSIFDTDFHTISPKGRRFCTDPEKIATKPVKVEDNVFIGTNSLICKGVTIGKNSIIGAGSVVVKNVQPSKIYAGNPAKEITHVS
jgi:acetyltransferase-like isoleucine patch superfamily enzyme